MGRVRNALRALALTDPRPAAVLAGLDRLFIATELEEQVTTVAYLVRGPGRPGRAWRATPGICRRCCCPGTPRRGWNHRGGHAARAGPARASSTCSGCRPGTLRCSTPTDWWRTAGAALTRAWTSWCPWRPRPGREWSKTRPGCWSTWLNRMLTGYEQDDDVTVLVLHVPGGTAQRRSARRVVSFPPHGGVKHERGYQADLGDAPDSRELRRAASRGSGSSHPQTPPKVVVGSWSCRGRGVMRPGFGFRLGPSSGSHEVGSIFPLMICRRGVCVACQFVQSGVVRGSAGRRPAKEGVTAVASAARSAARRQPGPEGQARTGAGFPASWICGSRQSAGRPAGHARGDATGQPSAGGSAQEAPASPERGDAARSRRRQEELWWSRRGAEGRRPVRQRLGTGRPGGFRHGE